jgi:hypothetical protein
MKNEPVSEKSLTEDGMKMSRRPVATASTAATTTIHLMGFLFRKVTVHSPACNGQ